MDKLNIQNFRYVHRIAFNNQSNLMHFCFYFYTVSLSLMTSAMLLLALPCFCKLQVPYCGNHFYCY